MIPAGYSSVLETPQRVMTVHDLLRHTSGFTYGFFGKSLVKDQYNAAKVLDAGQTSAEFITKLAQDSASISPRHHVGVQCVNRRTWADHRGCVRAPLRPIPRRARTRATEDERHRLLGRAARKHNRIAEPQADPATGKRPTVPDRTQKPNWLSGGGGMVSTAPDYARFCQFLLNGGKLDGVRLLSRKTVEYMASDHLPLGIRVNGFSVAVIDADPRTARASGSASRCGPALVAPPFPEVWVTSDRRHLRHPVLGGSEGADVRGDDAADSHSCDAQQVLDGYARPRVSGDRGLSVARRDHVRRSRREPRADVDFRLIH